MGAACAGQVLVRVLFVCLRCYGGGYWRCLFGAAVRKVLFGVLVREHSGVLQVRGSCWSCLFGDAEGLV